MMLYDFNYAKSTRQQVRKLQRVLQVNYWKNGMKKPTVIGTSKVRINKMNRI